MKLVIKPYRGTTAWFAVWNNPLPGILREWLIGRTKRLPTELDAMRIVNAWRIQTISHFAVMNGQVIAAL